MSALCRHSTSHSWGMGMYHGHSPCLSCAGALASGGGAPARQLLQFGAPEQLLAALEKVRACTRLIH